MKKISVCLVFCMLCMNLMSLQAVSNELFDLKSGAYKVGDELYNKIGKEGVLAILLGKDKKMPESLVKLIDNNAQWICLRENNLEDTKIRLNKMSRIANMNSAVLKKLSDDFNEEVNKITSRTLAACQRKSKLEVFTAIADVLAECLSDENAESKGNEKEVGCTIV